MAFDNKGYSQSAKCIRKTVNYIFFFFNFWIISYYRASFREKLRDRAFNRCLFSILKIFDWFFYLHFPTTLGMEWFRSKFSTASFHLIYMFWGPLNPKMWLLKIGLFVCMCVHVCDGVGNIQLFLSPKLRYSSRSHKRTVGLKTHNHNQN